MTKIAVNLALTLWVYVAILGALAAILALARGMVETIRGKGLRRPLGANPFKRGPRADRVLVTCPGCGNHWRTEAPQ